MLRQWVTAIVHAEMHVMAGTLHLPRQKIGEILALRHRIVAALFMRQQSIRCRLSDIPIKVVLPEIRRRCLDQPVPLCCV